MPDQRPGTPAAPLFRAVLGLEVFFGPASLAAIGFFPEYTAVKSVVMAAVLASPRRGATGGRPFS